MGRYTVTEIRHEKGRFGANRPFAVSSPDKDSSYRVSGGSPPADRPSITSISASRNEIVPGKSKRCEQ